MKLYHVTPGRNMTRILHEGITPDKSTGRRKVVWLCTYRRLMWALAHIAEHHQVKIDDLVVFSVFTNRIETKRTAWDGVFTSDVLVKVLDVQPASYYVVEYEEMMTDEHN